MSKEIQGPISELINRNLLGVTIDDSEMLRDIIDIVESRIKLIDKIENEFFSACIENIKNVIKDFMRNAVNLFNDSKLTEEERSMYRDLVWESSKYPNLSDSLKMRAGCCRYYHVLFYILAAQVHLGRAAVLNGKMIPGENFGYTWVIVENLDGEDIIVDIFEETVDPKYGYKDPSGKYENGGGVAVYENKESGFRFLF